MNHAGTERRCRARGNHSHLYKCFWFQGEPEQRCAGGFERSDISWRLECVDIGAENTGDRVTRPSWLQRMYLRGFTTHWSATLLDTSGGQDGGPCRQPMVRNFLLNPDDMTEGFVTTDRWSRMYYSAENQFERFRGFLELISRFEFEFRRCEHYFF